MVMNSGGDDETRRMSGAGGSRSADDESLDHYYSKSVGNNVDMKQLVVRCGELISASDLGAAKRMMSVLSAKSSPFGDSTQRLLYHFSTSLLGRLNNQSQSQSQSSQSQLSQSYLTLNQITPFIRFCHLTANQAILDHAMDNSTQSLHIIDLDIMHGLQWPPFMQALADRSTPPSLRITATGHDLPLLRRTGDRLLRFAHSLGLHFHFHPLHLIPSAAASHDAIIDLISTTPSPCSSESLAVNCVLYLHRLLDDHDPHSHTLRRFLHGIKSLNPRVVTVAEREANLSGSPHALSEALDHYAAIFDSLEATLPPNSRERLAVEQVWLSQEIGAAVAESAAPGLRSQRYDSWKGLLGSCGFSNLPLSPFALSQAKLLLRLHYPCEGFQLHILNHSFFLGWQNRPLFSLSSWH